MTKTILLAAIIAAAAVASLLTFTSLQNEAEAAPIPKAACPAQFVQHWDKIIFKPVVVFAFPFFSPEGETELIEGLEFDVKVRDNPDKLANLGQKTAEKLNELGYQLLVLDGTIDITQANIDILDVEYSIICAATPDPPIVR